MKARDWQIQEATRFAGRTFKRLMYFTCDRPQKFLPEVTETFTAFENHMIAEQETIEATAGALLPLEDQRLAVDYLTRHSIERAMEALRLGEVLVASIELRTRILYGLREPVGAETSRLDYDMVTRQVP